LNGIYGVTTAQCGDRCMDQRNVYGCLPRFKAGWTSAFDDRRGYGWSLTVTYIGSN